MAPIIKYHGGHPRTLETRGETRYLEESASPAWLAASAMNARDTTKGIYGGLTLDVDRHYTGSVTATTQKKKGTIAFESNPSRGTVLPAPHSKGNKCDKNVKYICA